MKLSRLKTEQEFDAILAWIDERFDHKTPPNSQEGETLWAALLFVKAYEDEHYPILR